MRRLIEIDLELHKRLDRTFATLDVGLIIEELQIVSRKKIDADCVLFLDGAQGALHSLHADCEKVLKDKDPKDSANYRFVDWVSSVLLPRPVGWLYLGH